MKAVVGKITGKVQGVGFRMYIYRQADRLGLNGWVKNNPDGSVEFYSVGSEVELSYFLDLVKRGNDFSVIENIEINDAAIESLNSFKVVQ